MATAQRVTKDLGSGAEGSAAPRRPAHDFALVIGVNDYPAFKSLKGPVDDATEFKTWLCDPDGGGVDDAHLRIVTSTATPIAPEQKHIDQALRALLETADAIGGGRRLYVYFSGHGAAARDAVENVALLLADWSEAQAKLGLSSVRYREDLVRLGLFEELVVILDCCRRAAPSIAGQECSLTLTLKTPPTETRWIVAYACAPGGSAFEWPDARSWSGVFTRCLLKVLRRADTGVPVRELENQLKLALVAEAAAQEPRVDGALAPDAVVGRRGRISRLTVTFAATTTGRVQLFGGSRNLVGEHDPASGAWSIALTEGFLYKLVHPASGHSEIIEFTGDTSREL